MATLFQTASQLRRILVFVLIGVIVILVVDNVSRFLNSPNNPFATQLSLYQPADSNFGAIPTPPMTSFTIAKDSNPTFTLAGAFNDFPDTGVVYSIEKPREKLDTVDNAVSVAANMGFTGSYTSISTDEISWTNIQGSRTLIFNKSTQKWRLRTKYLFDPAAQLPKTINPKLDFYQQIGTGIASRLGFDDKSLQQGNVVAQYALLGSDGLFTNPVDQASANYVSIDLFRSLRLALPKTLDQLPSSFSQGDLAQPVDGQVYRNDPLYGSLFGELHMIVSNQANDLKSDLYELDFTNYTYNYTNYTVRELITPSEAWDKVRQNQGALTQLRLDTADYFSLNQSLTVSKFVADATQSSLGYFEPDPWDGFLYPVYIFHGRAETTQGNANFTFFVDALRRFN